MTVIPTKSRCSLSIISFLFSLYSLHAFQNSGTGKTQVFLHFRPIIRSHGTVTESWTASPTNTVVLASSVAEREQLDTSVGTSSSTGRRDSNILNNNDFESSLTKFCDDRREFEMNLGKIVDTLKKDYPKILTKTPDFSIYHDDLEIVDPSGVKLKGLQQYKASFKVVHSIVSFFYCPESSGITFRLVFDWARNNVRVSWNAELVPKGIYGGFRNKMHVDGISVYEVDRSRGIITQHRVEHLMLNNNPLAEPQRLYHALMHDGYEGIPATGGYGSFQMQVGEKSNVELKSKLYTMTPTSDGNFLDLDAMERKNASRKKFGLKPLSIEEYLEVEAEVRQLETKQRQRQSQQPEMAQERKDDKRGNFLGKIFGDILADTCESNYDCRRPEICCDFLVKKMCCASGMFVGTPNYQPAPIPIPVDSGNQNRI